MASKSGATLTVDELRDEMHSEIGDLRRELQELRRLVQAERASAIPRPSKDELLAGLDEMAQLRQAILRRRGGQLLPSQADEIARMREERAVELLGDRAR